MTPDPSDQAAGAAQSGVCGICNGRGICEQYDARFNEMRPAICTCQYAYFPAHHDPNSPPLHRSITAAEARQIAERVVRDMETAWPVEVLNKFREHAKAVWHESESFVYQNLYADRLHTIAREEALKVANETLESWYGDRLRETCREEAARLWDERAKVTTRETADDICRKYDHYGFHHCHWCGKHTSTPLTRLVGDSALTICPQCSSEQAADMTKGAPHGPHFKGPSPLQNIYLQSDGTMVSEQPVADGGEAKDCEQSNADTLTADLAWVQNHYRHFHDLVSIGKRAAAYLADLRQQLADAKKQVELIPRNDLIRDLRLAIESHCLGNVVASYSQFNRTMQSSADLLNADLATTQRLQAEVEELKAANDRLECRNDELEYELADPIPMSDDEIDKAVEFATGKTPDRRHITPQQVERAKAAIEVYQVRDDPSPVAIAAWRLNVVRLLKELVE